MYQSFSFKDTTYEQAAFRNKWKHLHPSVVFIGFMQYIDGLVQERSNSIANALELPGSFSCTNP